MRFLVTHLADDGRNDMQLCQLCRTPAPLTGNQLVAVACTLLGANKNRLNKALGPDGIGKLGKPFLVKAAARLPRTDIDPFNRDFTKTRQLRLRCLPGPGGGCLEAPELAGAAVPVAAATPASPRSDDRPRPRPRGLAEDAGAFFAAFLAAGFFFAVSAFFAMPVIPVPLTFICSDRISLADQAAFASCRSNSAASAA